MKCGSCGQFNCHKRHSSYHMIESNKKVKYGEFRPLSEDHESDIKQNTGKSERMQGEKVQFLYCLDRNHFC